MVSCCNRDEAMAVIEGVIAEGIMQLVGPCWIDLV